MSRIPQKLLILHLTVVNTAHSKITPGKRAGLIKHHILHLRQRFQIIRPLDQHPRIARPADPCKKGKRNTDDQSTRTADNKKSERPVNPNTPLRRRMHKQQTHDRRNNRQRKRTVADDRCVKLRKPRDKRLGPRLVRTRILNQLQHL